MVILIRKRRLYVLLFFLVLFGGMTLAAWGRSKELSAMAEDTFRYSRTFVIDAGHGGEDGGAVSTDGTPESGINLEIALRLRDLLHFCGMETRMIRTEDISVNTPDAGPGNCSGEKIVGFEKSNGNGQRDPQCGSDQHTPEFPASRTVCAWRAGILQSHRRRSAPGRTDPIRAEPNRQPRERKAHTRDTGYDLPDESRTRAGSFGGVRFPIQHRRNTIAEKGSSSKNHRSCDLVRHFVGRGGALNTALSCRTIRQNGESL